MRRHCQAKAFRLRLTARLENELIDLANVCASARVFGHEGVMKIVTRRIAGDRQSLPCWISSTIEARSLPETKSGLRLIKSVQEKINPLAAFMNDCWERDAKAEAEGKGPTAETIHNVFSDWCRANDRHDLILRTPKAKLLAEIHKLPEWEWIKAFKPHGQVRRYPGLKRKAKHDV